MLILTRCLNENIVIGDQAHIQIKVLGIKGCQVRLGITAPKEVPVHRDEIYERIQKEQARIHKDAKEKQGG